METRAAWAIGIALHVLVAPSAIAARAPSPGDATAVEEHDIVVLNDNGAWSWFEGERAIVDADRGVLLASSVADSASATSPERDGAIEVVAHDLASSHTARSTLHVGAAGNDHNSAALYLRDDGRYLAMYSLHDADTLVRWRVSREPGDATRWGPERVLDNGAPTSYANVHPAGDGRLYAFVRAAGRDPHLLVSTDYGSSWSVGGRLLTSRHRPYVRYATDPAGAIHLIATDGQPSGNELVTGIYHGVVAGGMLLRSDGTVVDDDLFDDDAAPTTDLTMVVGAADDLRPWVIDLRVDADGNPHAVFSIRVPGDSAATDRREYHYARFDGMKWHVHHLAHAGSALAPEHRDYTGLAALDPLDRTRVVVSTDVDPVTGEPLISAADGERHFELFTGETTDGGATWTWTALTVDSTVDNIRPVIPEWDDGTVVLWLRGSYRDYRVYDLEVVAAVLDADDAADTRTSRSASSGTRPLRAGSVVQPICSKRARQSPQPCR